MPSGKQLSDSNFSAYGRWMTGKTDGDFRQMVSRGVLSRTEIARECGFSKSALDQNPRIKVALSKLEDGLRERGVLPPVAEPTPETDGLPMRQRSRHMSSGESEHVRNLEQENASLRAAYDELKRRLSKYEVLHEALVLTGRVPR
ncbi:VPA1267 family protein [Paraburkholderia phytofirmans]|uniref:VPA1267 family protein n=1 Tax=Paraburkholderia phytofirmans TaxID=261302 RepID=UPI0038BAFD8A